MRYVIEGIGWPLGPHFVSNGTIIDTNWRNLPMPRERGPAHDQWASIRQYSEWADGKARPPNSRLIEEPKTPTPTVVQPTKETK